MKISVAFTTEHDTTTAEFNDGVVKGSALSDACRMVHELVKLNGTVTLTVQPNTQSKEDEKFYRMNGDHGSSFITSKSRCSCLPYQLGTTRPCRHMERLSAAADPTLFFPRSTIDTYHREVSNVQPRF